MLRRQLARSAHRDRVRPLYAVCDHRGFRRPAGTVKNQTAAAKADKAKPEEVIAAEGHRQRRRDSTGGNRQIARGLRPEAPPLPTIPDDPPPHEGAMISLPHVIEPPDLVIIEVLEALPGRPISGERLVRPDGEDQPWLLRRGRCQGIDARAGQGRHHQTSQKISDRRSAGTWNLRRRGNSSIPLSLPRSHEVRSSDDDKPKVKTQTAFVVSTVIRSPPGSRGRASVSRPDKARSRCVRFDPIQLASQAHDQARPRRSQPLTVPWSGPGRSPSRSKSTDEAPAAAPAPDQCPS